MNIIDMVIIIMIVLAGAVGLKRGLFRGAVMSIGWFLLFIISFIFKNPVAEVLSMYLPFFNFWGAFKGVTVLNIILYQFIAFLIIYSLLMIIYVIAVKLTGVLESFLNATIILGIPSKILGFALGIIQGFILMFVIVFIITMPIFNIPYIRDTAFYNYVLKYTPLLSNVIKDTNGAIQDINNLKDEFKNNSNKEELNRQCLIVMFKHGIVRAEYIEKLVENGKIKMKGVEIIINEYR